jgi:hypothetical protein
MDYRADLAARDADILEHAVIEHHQMARGPLALPPGKNRRGASAYDESKRLHATVNRLSVDIVSAG